MKLEDQVCSLELAQKLKMLGVRQESLFWWSGYKGDGSFVIVYDMQPELPIERYSAFTVAELGEILPDEVRYNDLPYYWRIHRTNDEWAMLFQHSSGSLIGDGVFCATTEADARAKMLVYLIENKLIGSEALGAYPASFTSAAEEETRERRD